MISALIALLMHTHACKHRVMSCVVYLADAAALKQVTYQVMFLNTDYGTCQGNKLTSRKVKIAQCE